MACSFNTFGYGWIRRDELPKMEALYWGEGRWRDQAHYDKAAAAFKVNAEIWTAMCRLGILLHGEDEAKVRSFAWNMFKPYRDGLPEELKEAWI